MYPINHTLLNASTIAACLLLLPVANAGTITWDSANATSTDWSLGTNWVDDIAPGAGDDLVLIAGGSFDPTNNSGYTAISVNSITLDASSTSNLSLGSDIQVGAGGIHNNRVGSGSLFLSDVNITADSTWGGTRTIFVGGSITGSKMIFDGSGIRFDRNSASWSTGLDVHTSVGMNDFGDDSGVTITPWGTGTITLINQRTDLSTNSDPTLNLAFSANNMDLSTATTFANNIALADPGTGNYTINHSGDSATLAGGHWVKLTGEISGAVDTARTLSFTNTKGSDTPITFILEGANTHTATTTLTGDVTLGLGNVDALQNSTLDTGASDASKAVTFDVAGTNTYNLGGLTGADELDVGANTVSVGDNDLSNTYNGVVSGTGGFTKVGSGTQTFTDAQTYTGATTISEGTLQLGNGGTTGALSTSSAIANDGVFSINRSNAVVQGVDFSGDPITGTGSISNVGSGRLTLDGANTYSGGTNFTGDTLTVASEGALGTGAVVGDTAGGNTAILTFNTTSDATFANDITAGASGSGIVNDSATSVVTLNGNVSFNDGTTFQGFQGTGVDNAGFVIGGNVSSTTRLTLKDTNLTLASTGTVGPTFGGRITLGDVGGSGSAVYVADGADFTLRIQDSQNTAISNDAMTFIVGMNTAGTGTFSSSDSVNLLANGSSVANDWEFLAVTGATANFTGKIISNNANANAADVTVTKTGDGTVVFAQDNTYIGDTIISAGTLQIGNGGSAGSLSADSTITNNGTLIFNTTSSLVQGTDFSTAPITGTGSLSIVGGDMTLNAANTYAGGTSIDGGTLTAAAEGAFGNGAITGTSNSVLTFNTASDATFNNDITFVTPSDTGLVNNSTTSTVTLGGTVELTGAFATLVGTGVNNAGFVLADGAVLKAGAGSRLGLKDTSLTIQAGGAVDYSATGFQRLTLGEAGGSGAAVYLEDGADLDMVIYDTNNGNVTSDTMEFIVGMQSAGTATFSGLGGEAVDLNHRNNAGSLANAWKLIAVAGATANFTGSIVNDNTNHQSTITKTGAGTVNFSATNTYGGSTTVEDGVLAVTGTGSINNTSSVTVQNGATFQYDSTTAFTAALNLDSGSTLTGSGDLGTVALTIGSGVTLAPGNSPGELATGSQTWSDGGDYNWQVLDASGVAGTGYDTATITGSLDLSGLTAGGFEVNIWSLSSIGPDVSGDALNFDDSSDYQWTIASTTGGITGFDADNISIVLSPNNGTDGFSNSFTGTFSVSSDGNDLFVDYTAVPEPTTFALLAGCLALSSVVLRRRRA
ncbi:MAG: autotransporter-associated beta strand repeat-containing protein [Opitutaceae bacterium]